MWPLSVPPQARIAPATAVRSLVFAVGTTETFALAMFAALMLQSTDPLGAELGRSVAPLLAAPYAALTVPGMILAYLNRRLPLALTLVFLAIPAAILLWRHT